MERQSMTISLQCIALVKSKPMIDKGSVRAKPILESKDTSS